MNVFVLSRYGELGASSRLRLFQYLPYLRAQGISVQVASLFSDEYLRSYYKTGHKHLLLALKGYLKRVMDCTRFGRHDLIWLEKELFPWLPALFERAPFSGGIPYVVDYDDAIHHN